VTALFIQFQRHHHWGNLRRVTTTLPKHYLRRFINLLKRRSKSGDLLLRDEVVGYVQGILYFARHWRSEALVIGPRVSGGADDER
jgi:hypothetical protein